jgi:hypothetical protein
VRFWRYRGGSGAVFARTVRDGAVDAPWDAYSDRMRRVVEDVDSWLCSAFADVSRLARAMHLDACRWCPFH